jgi:small-conductance mechanosensitive channel
MNDARNALTVDAVVGCFTVAEQLLSDAAERVQSLGDATESATESSAALTQAARGLTTASNQLVAMTIEMKAAHDSLVGAMSLARQFLEATDVTAVREALQRLDQRVADLQAGQTSPGEQLRQNANDQTERLSAVSGSVDRSAVLENERDAGRRRLNSVMQQNPPPA